MRVVTQNLNLVTGFPVLNGALEYNFKVKEVLEWKDWPEADISGSVANENNPGVTFFATDYILKKPEYTRENLKVWLGMIAYMASTNVSEKHEVGEVDGTPVVLDFSEAELLFPGTFVLEGAFIDDYFITGKITEFKEIEEGYLVRIKNYPLGEVMVYAKKSAVEGEIEKGKPIKVVDWLQGSIK
ncbi:hypothetical protein [Pyrococcus kukulkanii]|uniref:hypothetical protein n=1 Tax=Pyrococcus kukulkanii TaxID=1609559 RepID=UPI0035647030